MGNLGPGGAGAPNAARSSEHLRGGSFEREQSGHVAKLRWFRVVLLLVQVLAHTAVERDSIQSVLDRYFISGACTFKKL